MVGGRLLVGLFLLRRWTRDARDVTCPEWLAAFERARGGADDRLRLMVSDSVPSPLSWGWRRPVILIDPDTLDEPEEADAILAHEMAHVARRDWLALMLTRIAATLFWFNPLVWLLEREIVQQAEEAADCEAARPCRAGPLRPDPADLGAERRPRAAGQFDRAQGQRARPPDPRDPRPAQPRAAAGLAWTAVAALALRRPSPRRSPRCSWSRPPGRPPPGSARRRRRAAPGAGRSATRPASPHAPDAPPAPPAPVADIPDIPDIPDVSSEVHAALAEVLPHIPEIVASAMASVDPEEIERRSHEALREAGPEIRRLSRPGPRAGAPRGPPRDRRRPAHRMARGRRGAGPAQAGARRRSRWHMRDARRAVAAVRPTIRVANGARRRRHGARRRRHGARRRRHGARRPAHGGAGAPAARPRLSRAADRPRARPRPQRHPSGADRGGRRHGRKAPRACAKAPARCARRPSAWATAAATEIPREKLPQGELGR